QIFANVAISGPQPVPISAPQVPVGDILLGKETTTSSNLRLVQCAPHNSSLLGGTQPAAFDLSLKVTEGFAAALKVRNVGSGTFFYPTTYPPPLLEQNVPGFNYNTESAFY